MALLGERGSRSEGTTATRTSGLIVLFFCAVVGAHGREMDLVLDLRGEWLFEIGDRPEWAFLGLDDSRWDRISVPSAWEDQGYAGYDGYAWYRKHIRLPRGAEEKILYLLPGAIDDADEVYVNGRCIGFSGQFPPEYITAYNTVREYLIPPGLLDPQTDNVIAVRVYDQELAGGMVHGRPGIYADRSPLRPDFDLTGKWRFTTGDDPGWSRPSFDDRRWTPVDVPAHWETQSAKGYDGFAWYRTRFTLPVSLRGKKLILLLGRIDDNDQTYVNGILVGSTGADRMGKGRDFSQSAYLELRAYPLQPGDLKERGENVLAVRVYDGFLHGGIYDLPVGLIERERYFDWQKKNREEKGGLQEFLKFLFR